MLNSIIGLKRKPSKLFGAIIFWIIVSCGMAFMNMAMYGTGLNFSTFAFIALGIVMAFLVKSKNFFIAHIVLIIIDLSNVTSVFRVMVDYIHWLPRMLVPFISCLITILIFALIVVLLFKQSKGLVKLLFASFVISILLTVVNVVTNIGGMDPMFISSVMVSLISTISSIYVYIPIVSHNF